MYVTFALLVSGKTDFSVWIIEWLARSEDISTSICFLWGYFKERVNKDNPQTGTDLKEVNGKKKTMICSEVTKTVIESVQKKAWDCI